MKIQYAAGALCACLLLPTIIIAQDAANTIPKQSQQRDTAHQTDLIDIGKALFHIKPQKIRVQREKKIYFSVLPVPGAVPGGAGRALITSTTAGTYLGPQSTTNLSSANFAPYWNFKGRFGIPLRTSIWLPNNTWNIQGDIRLLVYPQYTWGLGNTDNDQNKTLVNQNYIRFYQTALKKITPYFYAGGGYNLDYHSNINSDEPGIDLQQFTHYSYGTQSSSLSSGINLSLLYDTRNNSINPLPGSYLNIVYRANPTFLGSNQKWNSLYIDARKYLPLDRDNPTRQNTLAFWSYFWTVFNSNAPYLDLPGIGSDPYNRSGEGLEQNRYRGRSLVYLETEYRRDITGNGLLGFVAFVNATTVSGSGSLLRSWHPAAGTGLRIKFNKGSNTNIGIDYAFSKGYSAIVLNLGEKF
ncbi:BamA/TamA family outer membrane protein [Mucilaginibacter sp. RS28]|uniref:BamA/TamA family outer membrane protein n=1 Tax=Mucilaginibacter straminoryzae TaxID=2932774 RepID=A0A9X2BF26_9SPHI|nr:BamA/TamA family outer membrane protein [Mucilaginibacter straminoryzae]MCJ8212073.1 BamA/TamA family outer membrane protein [Mucilaginibacter straminoryzae]